MQHLRRARAVGVTITALLAVVVTVADGHGGGHTNRKTGKYHYHRKATSPSRRLRPGLWRHRAESSRPWAGRRSTLSRTSRATPPMPSGESSMAIRSTSTATRRPSASSASPPTSTVSSVPHANAATKQPGRYHTSRHPRTAPARQSSRTPIVQPKRFMVFLCSCLVSFADSAISLSLP